MSATPTATQNGFYPVDQAQLARRINVAPAGETPQWATFYLEHPALAHGNLEETRERMIELESYKGDKIKGKETVMRQIDLERADVPFFNKLFRQVICKPDVFSLPDELLAQVERTKEGELIIPADLVVPIDYSDVDTQELYPERAEPYRVVDLITMPHKSTVVQAVLSSGFRVLPAPYKLGAARKWIVEQFGAVLGGYTLRHVFREPSEGWRSRFGRQAFSTYLVQGLSEQNREQVPQQVSHANLGVVREFYREIAFALEGASVAGEPFDTHKPEHMKWLLLNYQSGALIQLKTFLDGDAGN